MSVENTFFVCGFPQDFFTSLSPRSSVNDNVCSEKLKYEIQ